jgi:hypothetical protein
MGQSVSVGRGRSHCAAVHCLRQLYQEEGGPLPRCLPRHLLSVEGDQNARSPLALVTAKPLAYYGAENRGAEGIRMVTHQGVDGCALTPSAGSTTLVPTCCEG